MLDEVRVAFGSRRDDTSGLGDWVVSTDAHPQGLGPLIEHVTGLGMQFGIWVEPEMVSPDSGLYRAHPEWALTTDGYEPVLARNQLVLELAQRSASTWTTGGAILGGDELAHIGLQPPPLHAETAMLIHIQAVRSSA